VRLERCPQAVDDLVALAGIFPQQHAAGAHAQGERHRLLKAVAADEGVVGVDLDGLEAALGKDAPDPVGVGEREGARARGIGRRRLRGQMLERRAHWQQHPLVQRQGPPADERQPAAGPKRLMQIGEGGRRVAEEHHPEAREDGVGPAAGEGAGLGVGLEEPRIGQARLGGPASGDGQHGRGDVDAEHRSVRPDLAGQLQAGLAAAATDIDQTFVSGRPEGRHGRTAERLKLAVEPVLLGHPGFAGRRVPVCDLVGVGGRFGISGHERARAWPCPGRRWSAGTCGR